MQEQRRPDANDAEPQIDTGRAVRAVIDRFVDDVHAVLLVGPEELELIVPRAMLPGDAAEGAWLRVQLDGQTVVAAALDESATDAATARIVSKLERLRRRGSRLAGGEGTD